jgi:hypothetical protein
LSLARALEAAASALPEYEDAIRPANGDPERLLAALTPLAATQVLAWLLDNHPDDGEELALAWADLETGSAPLRGVADGPIGKAGRKRHYGWRPHARVLSPRGYEGQSYGLFGRQHLCQ